MISLILIGILLVSWGLIPDLLRGGLLFWIAFVGGGITAFVVNLVRPRYESATGGWRAFYDFLLRHLTPPD